MKFTPQEPIWTPLAPTFTTIEAFRREINRKHPHLRLRMSSSFTRHLLDSPRIQEITMTCTSTLFLTTNSGRTFGSILKLYTQYRRAK